MIVTSLTDPVMATIDRRINVMAHEAIEWFDVARRVKELANTEFTFYVSRYVGCPECYEKGDDQISHVFSWHRYEKDTFSIGFGGGAAYDERVRGFGARSFLEPIPGSSSMPTASFSLAQIISVNDLTSDVFLKIREAFPYMIEHIELEVTLFDAHRKSINSKKWVF